MNCIVHSYMENITILLFSLDKLYSLYIKLECYNKTTKLNTIFYDYCMNIHEVIWLLYISCIYYCRVHFLLRLLYHYLLFIFI